MLLYQRDVLKFRKTLGLHVGNTKAPGFHSDAEANLDAGLINEEIGETVAAIRRQDVLEIIDGICDSLYVAIGAGIAFGLDLASLVGVLREARRHPNKDRITFRLAEHHVRLLLGGARSACSAIEARDVYQTAVALVGLIHVVGAVAYALEVPIEPFWMEVQRANMSKIGGGKRPDGKILKPVGWRGPDHLSVLAKLHGLRIAGRTEAA